MGLGKITLTAAVLLALSSVVSAQTKQANPSVPDDAQVSSPRWNSQYASQNSMAGADQLLTQTVMAVPQARADAVVARWTYTRVNHDLNLAANFLLRDFRESQEYDQAFSEFQTAYDQYEAARTKALTGMRNDEKYQAVISIRKNVSDQIADEHDQKDPDGERLVSLAGLKVDSISSFREQERDVLAADQNVVAARQRLMAAGKNLAKIEKDFSRKTRDNTQLADLRKSREDARIAMLASAAYLDESRTARDIALRYAYVSRGYDRYVPRLINTDYGYGHGYRYTGISTPIYYPAGTVR